MSDINAIVVVNNNSTDGTKEWLGSLHNDRVYSLDLDENIGGAGGFYEGVKYTHEVIKDYDWLLFFDDDAYVQKGSIKNFINRKYGSEIDSIISAVYYPDGDICDMNVPGFYPFKSLSQIKKSILNGNKGFHIDRSLYGSKNLHRVDFASFVGLFIRKEVVNKIGYPDPEWFIYGDDLDYTTKITSNGFSLYFDPAIKFIHDCQTISKMRKIYNPIWKVYFTYRNGLMIYKKLSGKLFPFIVVLKSIQWIYATRHYEDKKFYLKLTLHAIYDGLTEDRTKKLKDIDTI